jgi:hypothetical protein
MSPSSDSAIMPYGGPVQRKPETVNPATQTLPEASSCWAAYEWWALGLGLYVFSIGPIYWMWYQGKFTQSQHFWIAVLYEPLWWSARLIPPLGYWLDSYVRWWILS